MEMVKKHEVVVAGGGASGMVAAIFASRNGRDTAILESNDILGKKLLATGNGKCNFTNSVQQKDCYRGGSPEAAMKLLGKYGTKEILGFFEELGIYPKQRNGYWYPYSEQASSVREILEAELRRCGVKIYANCHLNRAFKRGNEFLLEAEQGEKPEESVKTKATEKTNAAGKINAVGKINAAGKINAVGKKAERNSFLESHLLSLSADYLVLATGGMAGNIKGADGSGYSLAEGFGHRIVPPVPALVQLKSSGAYFKALAGVRVDAFGRLLVDGTEYREQGEFLFTDYGLSGIPAMQLSCYASVRLNRSAPVRPNQGQNHGKVKLFLDFFPDISENSWNERLLRRFQAFPERTAGQVLVGLLPSKLNQVLLKEAGMAVDEKSQNHWAAQEKKIRRLAGLMKKFAIPIIGTNSFETAQVTAGGVSMDELYHDTMESKKVKGLYITGELADIDGTCGGYNLHWAWMTGMAAAEGIGKRTL